MTPNSAYLQWLDREIEGNSTAMMLEMGSARAYWAGRIKQAVIDREAFLSLYPSQTIDSQEVDNDEARQFTDGLD